MRRKKARGVIGIALMLISIVTMYYWLTYGQEALGTKAVLTAIMDIEPGAIICPEKHFKEDRIGKDLLISNGLTKSDLQALTEMASKQFIPRNAQISSKYFIKESLAVNGDKEIFEIPSTWIYAVPSSIRRGDDINIYEIDSNIEDNLNEQFKKKGDGFSTYPDTSIIRLSSDEPILSVSVIYVKDSTNREVVDADERKRHDGTSQISSVEIVCTKEEIKTLEQKIAEGMMFIISYH